MKVYRADLEPRGPSPADPSTDVPVSLPFFLKRVDARWAVGLADVVLLEIPPSALRSPTAFAHELAMRGYRISAPALEGPPTRTRSKLWLDLIAAAVVAGETKNLASWCSQTTPNDFTPCEEWHENHRLGRTRSARL